MAECYIDDVLRGMSIQNAARDEVFCELQYWMLSRRSALTGCKIAVIDQAELYADIAEKYGLSPDEMVEATETCRARIITEANHG